MDLALNKLQKSICHKTQTNKQTNKQTNSLHFSATKKSMKDFC